MTPSANNRCPVRVEVACVFPGVVRTDVFRSARGLPRLAPLLQRLIGITPGEAAQTPVFLAQDRAATGTGGRFYGPRLKQHAVPDRARDP